jgi:tetratricopeptide (TPR) repeat protein
MEKALRIDSTIPSYHLTYADLMFAGRRPSLSKKSLETVLRLDPENKDALLKLAEIYFFAKQYESSVKFIDKVLAIDVHLAKAYFMKGMNFKEAGDTGKSISSFQTAAEQDPQYYDAYMQLGMIMSTKKNPLALNYYNNALRIQPESQEALYGRAMFMQESGAYNQAIDDYKKILSLNPSSRDAHYNQGYIALLYQKDYKTALRHFEDALKADPHDAEALYNRGLCNELTGNRDAAKRDFENTLKENPDFMAASERLKNLK